MKTISRVLAIASTLIVLAILAAFLGGISEKEKLGVAIYGALSIFLMLAAIFLQSETDD